MLILKLYQGKNISPFIAKISEFRLQAFKEYPYLYIGNLEEENKYLASYASTPEALLAVIFDTKKDNLVVGISTGLPLSSDGEICRRLKEKFISQGYDPSKYFYYGEVIVLPAYRSKKLASQMYEAKENKAVELGFTSACILTVEREFDDPQKPIMYRDTCEIWNRLGFVKAEKLGITYNWKTVCNDGKTLEKDHPMSCWFKEFPKASK